MSYCRWSTDIKRSVPLEEQLFLYKNNVPNAYQFIQKLERRRHSETSDWYIYWHSNGDDTPDQTRDDQLLAIWHCADQSNPIWSYDQVKAVYEQDAWEDYLDVITQRSFMVKCVAAWLEDVETEYPE
jgi:hypothetical protein